MSTLTAICAESLIESQVAEIDEKILDAIKAYNKAQLLIWTLRAEREILLEEV